MKYIKPVLLPVFCIVLTMIVMTSCSSGPVDRSSDEHIARVNEWHQKRVESLTRPDGWLTLAGLFWLEEGENSFGSSESNDIVFPEGTAPGFMGVFILNGENIRVKIDPGVEVKSADSLVTEMDLVTDARGEQTILTYGSLSWYVIKRGEKFGIRLKDSSSEELKNFKGIDRFPVDSAWVVKARFIKHDSAKTIAIPSVLGTISDEPSPGTLEFEINGGKYTLDPIGDETSRSYFIIFADYTNGEETYGAGRFLVVDKPGENGTTIIDFNQAYSPPCAFTPYATCPLPPQQNNLKVKVTAGEKNYAGGHH